MSIQAAVLKSRTVAHGVLVLTMLLGLPGHAGGDCSSPEGSEIDWAEVSPAMLAGMPFRDAAAFDLSHYNEQRGLLDVPLDYAQSGGPRLGIFYRLLPSSAEGSVIRDKPILVIMNGGPGVPSSAYRSLDFDYAAGQSDTLSGLAQHFRLLLVDQRGTGKSSPLDLDDPKLSAPVMARFFDSDEHALDHARVIEHAVPTGQPFFILARSYGGEIGFQYLLAGESVRQPVGMIFSSAILPHSEAMESFVSRREKQRQLNLQLKKRAPASIEKLEHLRRKAAALGLDPGSVNFLWADLGGSTGWELDLELKIDGLLALETREALASAMGGAIVQSVNLLNYVLSSAALTPGYTDRTITVETGRRVLFEPWMLDENWTLNQLGADGSWRECFIEAVDRNPPPPTAFPEVADIRQALSSTPVLFTFGTEDAFVPGELQMDRARALADAESAGFVLLEGGHGAAFSEEGAQVVADWARKVLESDTGENWP